jgi:hypothetical protein
MQPPPHPTGQRRHQRQQLVLKVEYDDAEGFRSNFLSDLSEGGVRINTTLEVGQRILLNISFLRFVEPVQIEAVVQWTLPSSHPDGPSSGLAFVDPTPEATAWLADVLDASTQLVLPSGLDEASRVILLEPQPFLRDVYCQEVRNWAELRDEDSLNLIAVDQAAGWIDEVTRGPAMLGIIDVDELGPGVALELYRRMRHHDMSNDLPIIIIGSPVQVEQFAQFRASDDLLLCLKKPLLFGVLMNTVRVLARDPLATVIRTRGSRGDTAED